MKFDHNRKLHLTVSDEILCELGKTVVFQTLLEKTIASEISELLGVDNVKGEIITAEFSFQQLIGMLNSLLLHRLGKENDLYNDFEVIKKELHEFYDFRNSVAHSLWGHSLEFSDTKAHRFKVTSKEKDDLKYQDQEIDLSHIIERLDAAGVALGKLTRLVSKVTGKKILRIHINNKQPKKD